MGPYSSTLESLVAQEFVSAVATMIFAVAAILFFAGSGENKKSLGGIFATVAVVGGLIASGVNAFGKIEWTEELVAQVESTYGLTLTFEQVRELRYPHEAPKGDFVSYGTVTLTVDDKPFSVTLAAEDGNMLLFSGVDELPHARAAD